MWAQVSGPESRVPWPGRGSLASLPQSHEFCSEFGGLDVLGFKVVQWKKKALLVWAGLTELCYGFESG